ncbi:uncharacterized protein WCC33_011539 [Rhinophrynus dorsalis]
MFVASKDNYPVYDVNNLYNTNPRFDWGKFRLLAEELWLSSRPILPFVYQFQEPGVYVLKLSSNHYKKMYIRVMINGGQCYEEGPFFPTVPRHVIRMGIAKTQQLRLKPDWPAIFGIFIALLLILITSVLFLVWFQDLGWAPKSPGCPQFRKVQLKFNFDSYSSKGSTVTISKKLHPKMRIKGHMNKKWDESDKKKCYKFLADDEFWDYEQQIDMECFNSHIFYDILLKQSLLVTAKLGHLKEEVKIFYEKLVSEVSTLKEMFIKCLSITKQPKCYANSIMESYTKTKKEGVKKNTQKDQLLRRNQVLLVHVQDTAVTSEDKYIVPNLLLKVFQRGGLQEQVIRVWSDTDALLMHNRNQCTQDASEYLRGCGQTKERAENWKYPMLQAEMEITKRKKLAAEFEDIVNKQLSILQQDLKSMEEHCVTFNGALRESDRLLEMLKDRYNREESAAKNVTNNCQKILLQIEAACNTMYNAVMKECDRLKVWCILGDGIGAHLVNKERTKLLSKQDLMALDGSVRDPDLLYVNPIHGLLTPAPHSFMMLSSHYLTPVPSDYFVHSETGKVLPIAGNVGYDTATSQLIPTVDSTCGNIWKPQGPIFPFIPYPVCPSTGLPVDCNLPILHHQGKDEACGLMVDPKSGIKVPILAVTIHPQTRRWLALGGTYLHPLTGILSPIEIGGPMMDVKREKLFPILGVALDSSTGDVIPVGGLLTSSGMIAVLGDVFTEPLSGKKNRIQGAVLYQDKLVPHTGGYQTLLESNMLIAQINVIDALKTQKYLLSEAMPVVTEELDHTHRILKEAVVNMKKCVSVRQKHMMYRMCNIINLQKMATDMKCYGGNLGMINYPKTDLWIPAVLGMEIPDPGPSDLMVPILGVQNDFNKGHLIPLAGTMEDSDGRGLIPIKLGAKTIDPVSGHSSLVVGAKTNPLTGVVMPVVQTSGLTNEIDYYLLESLEKELTLRDNFWESQKNKEEELLKDLNCVTLYILDVAKAGKIHKIRVKDKIVLLEELCQSLEENALCETQRRNAINLNSLSLKFSELPFVADGEEEKEQQLIFSLVVRKIIEKLTQFTDKMEQEAERIHKQLKEWQKSNEQSVEDTLKANQIMIMLHLIEEFEDHIMKRLAGVDSAYCRLEYVRECSKLQGLQAKSCLLGTTPYFLNQQAAHWNVTGTEVKYVGQNLIPMLKYLIQIMEDNKNSLLSEVQAPVSGYSSRSTLKASAANSDNFNETQNMDKSKHTIYVPWLNNSELFNKHQGYLLRFLMEKQAGELVHLERLLVTEAINRIWNFYETYKLNLNGKIKENLSNLVYGSHDQDKQHTLQLSPGKTSESGQDLYFEWKRLLQELANVHRAALQALHQRHQEEVKSMRLNSGTAIPEHYFSRDLKAFLLQLAVDIQTVYENPCYDNQTLQGMSSAAVKVFTEDKDSQHGLLRTIAAKFVKQELMAQVHMYEILDLYNKLQVDNCIEDMQKILYSLHYKPCSGKAAAEETSNSMEDKYIEKLIALLKNSYKQEQLQSSQLPLSEIQSQLKDEHYTLTEQLLENKNKLFLQELTSSQNRSNVEQLVYCVLSQRHLRQAVVLLQEAFMTQSQDQKISRKWKCYETRVEHSQDDILNIFQNKEEASLLFMELHHVIKRIQLREHHLEEIAKGLKDYCSDKVHVLSCVEEAYYLANELHTFREQKLKRLMEELIELSENSKDNDKSNIQQLEAKQERARQEKELLKDLQEKQAELEQAHRKQITEERLMLQDRLERGELSGFMKQKLIREHDETVAYLEKTLQRDLDKLNVKLEEELTKKRQEETIHLTTSSSRSCLQNADQNILALLADNISIFQQAEQIVASRITLLGPKQSPSILKPEDATTTLESSPVLTLLKEVDAQLRVNAQKARIIQGNNEPDKVKHNSFRDLLDLQLTWRMDLIPVPPEELTTREFVIYQYGVYILQILKPLINTREVTLHIASSLPENCHKSNAFSHSFFYQHSENNLFVSREYLQSVGSFILLLVHCISHIASDDLSDDSNPYFLRIFYQPLKNCEEMLSQHEIEVLLKSKLAKMKRDFFTQSLKDENDHGDWSHHWKQIHSESITVENMEESLDQLNIELMKILEKEIDSRRRPVDTDGQHCYFQMLSLEKECLKKKIEQLEQKVNEQDILE